MVLGNPREDQVVILWDTSAACKTSSSLRYTPEAKCYHLHPYHQDGLRASFMDLTSLVRPQGYHVLSSEDSSVQLLLSVCKPVRPEPDHSACNGSMACLVSAGTSLGSGVSSGSLPLVLGAWSREDRLHMHEGLLTVEYNVSAPSGGADSDCSSGRSVRVHFLCPNENQVSV